MAGLTLSTQGLVLLKRPPKENFQPLTVFSAEHGHLTFWQRVPKHSGGTGKTTKNATPPLDLFDEAEFLAESPNQGQSWFIKETRLLHRPSGIARSYDALRHACEFTATLARNRVPEEVRSGVMQLLRRSLAAFAEHTRPDITHLKALYSFARDEGYPLRQHWLPTLPSGLRTVAQTVLSQPLAEQNPPTETVAALHTHLTHYLRHHTEILVD